MALLKVWTPDIGYNAATAMKKKATVRNPGPSQVTSIEAPANGGSAWSVPEGSYLAIQAIPTASSKLRVGLWIWEEEPNSNYDYMLELEVTYGLVTGTRLAAFAMQHSIYPWIAYDTNGATVDYTEIFRQVQEGWRWVEMHITNSLTVATIEVWVDGEKVADLTGKDTGIAAFSGTDPVNVRVGSGSQYTYIGGVVVWDDSGSGMTGYQGPMRIETLTPNGDDATDSDWVQSAGANIYDAVDSAAAEVDDVSDYIYAATVGDRQLFDLTNLAATDIYTVEAVTLETLIGHNDGVWPCQMKTLLKSGATESDGTSKHPKQYGAVYDIWEVDPNTASAWTTTAVNALQSGAERISP
ncbi:MAG: hypothetical protein ACPGO3_09885 [Magnetospiraceae bacterium]